LNYGSLAVGFAIGAFAFTALASRPIAGHIADSRGRRPVVAVGAALAAVAGGLYFVPAGLPGLLVARLVLGAGEGTVFTAGATWVIDLAPLDRRAQVIGLYGLRGRGGGGLCLPRGGGGVLRPRAARPAGPGDRPLRPRGLGWAGPRPADRDGPLRS